MFEQFSLVLSALYVVQGVLGLAEQRIYTTAQRASEPLLSRLHLVSSIAFTVCGIASASWVHWNGIPTTWYPTILACGMLVSILVQGRMYRAMGVSHSPVIDRVSALLQ
ncbi:hypothetical protein [Natrinema longum]|uniref:Uncharacterized protein n=1 Tax=Natrinema longum TaxID=370324 RepID=A0A8A2U9L4_9EURY|nr:hypothetical protein [Natrinema longum]MBZ6493562.1 hypothetical protein [Natrinema longum]QSW85092.1 hypothetical protein J0X27_16860 [Natrinema longum]